MKKLLVVTGSLLLLVLVALSLYVRSDAFLARLHRLAEQAVADAAGPSVRFGSVRANLIPPYFEVRDVVLAGSDGRPAATIRKVRGYLNPLPLVVRRVSIPRVVIIEPRVSLVRFADGTTNLSAFLVRITEEPGRAQPERPTMQASFRTIAITRGSLSFHEARSGRSYRIDRITASVRREPTGRGASVRLSSGLIQAPDELLPVVMVSLVADAFVGADRIEIRQAMFRSDDASLSLRGRVGLGADAPLSLDIRGTAGPQALGRVLSVSRPPAGSLRRFSATLSGSVRGTVTSPDLTGVADVRGVPVGTMLVESVPVSFRYGAGTFTLSSRSAVVTRGKRRLVVDAVDLSLSRRNGAVELTRFSLGAGDLTADLSGTIAPGGAVDAVLSIESGGEGRTIAVFTTVPLGGRLAVRGRLTGTLAALRMDGTVSAWPLVVRGLTFEEVGGSVRYEHRRLILTSLRIRQGASLFGLGGEIDFAKETPVFSARLAIEQGDAGALVGLFFRPLPVEATASGVVSFQGSLTDFHASAALTLERGRAYGESFDRATVSVVVTPRDVSFPQVLVYKGSGIVKATGRIGFDETYDAAVESAFIDVAEIDWLRRLRYAGPFRAVIASSGTFSAPGLDATLEVPRLSAPGAVIGPLSARIGIDGGTLAAEVVLAEKAVRLAGRLALRPPYEWAAQATVAVERFDPFPLAGQGDLAGRIALTLDGEVALRGRGAEVRLLEGSGRFRKFSAAVGDYRLDADAEPSFELNNGTLVLGNVAFSGPETRFSITGSANLLREYNLAIAGTARLSLLRLFFDVVDHGSGEATSAIAVRGPWHRPAISGQVRLVNGEIKVRDVPQRFTDLAGTVEFDEERIVTENLRGSFGGGRMAVSGWVALSGFSLKDFSARATFDGVTVRYPEGLTSTLSGALVYEGNGENQALSGDVRILRARYEKRIDWKSMLVEMGGGFTRPRKPETGWIGATGLNLRFSGRENILLRNNLANIPLEIDVMLGGTVAQPQLLGRIEATKGVVYFRRNDFSILRATVGFFDPHRINPSLDIQAETRVRQYDIRLAVSGTAERAQVIFLSDPPLSDTDILSLLALGRTGTEIRGAEGTVGAGEAASFATGRFQDVFEQRARSITGLDRVQIDPYVGRGDTSVPRITVGKELVKDKLYFTYSSNVTAEPEQAFRLEYLIGKRVSLVGEGTETGNFGADVKFRFEFR